MIFVDENGEPSIVYHSTTKERKGKPMSKEELHLFAVEILVNLYKSEGMKIIDENRIIGNEYPQFVMKSKNGNLYYVVVETSIFPTKPDTFYSTNYSSILQLANDFNATSVFAGISFANVTNENINKIICGDGYFVAYKGLVHLKQ